MGTHNSFKDSMATANSGQVLKLFPFSDLRNKDDNISIFDVSSNQWGSLNEYNHKPAVEASGHEPDKTWHLGGY